VSLYSGLINRYRSYLPVSANTPVISLCEGNTPLIYAPRVSEILGKNYKVFLKYEGLNPTGSFKDRGMTMAMSKAVEGGTKAVICASTGNTSASAAAYAARAGVKCVVILPEGAIAMGKLAQAMIHGAQVIAIRGNFDDALDIVCKISENYPVTLVNSINPDRIEGQKTASFEIIDALGQAPDYHVLPVGNAGNITAYWKGYKEYHTCNKADKLPRMLGFQAAGAAPIVKNKIIKEPETIATAIRIGNPASWQQAVAARDESKGIIDMVTDKEILKAYQFLASQEGVFAEPASCAPIAGLFKLKKDGYFKPASKETIITATLTGHGLKDPKIAMECIKKPKVCAPKIEAVLKLAGIK
jgi:threonine synthase